MRRVSLACVGLACLAAAVAPPPAHAWRPDVRSARAYAAGRAGSVSFAVRTSARAYGWRAQRTYSSASVVKAMLLVAYLRRRSVKRRRLRIGEVVLLTPMIRVSDNGAATRVRDIVGNGGLRSVARRARMRRFATAPSWGSTRITASDQARLFLNIDRYVPRRHRRFAMSLLNTITPSQRWGVARARPRSWALYFKGGWGFGLDHQVALLRRGGRRVSLAILTSGDPSQSYGNRTLEGVARRLLRGLGRRSLPR